jgi:hypothetical protein
MDTVLSLTMADVVAALLLLTLMVAIFLFARWTNDESRPLLLKRMISRAGAKLTQSDDPLLGDKLAAAARVCAGCRNREECEILLAEESEGDIPDYCPNRRWITSLRAKPA